MTLGTIKTEVRELLRIHGAALVDYESWSSPAVTALARRVEEFMVLSKARLIEWAVANPSSGSNIVSLSSIALHTPIAAAYGTQRLLEVAPSSMVTGSIAGLQSGAPSAWSSREATPYEARLDRLATTSSLSTDCRWWGIAGLTSSFESDDANSTGIVDRMAQEGLVKFVAGHLGVQATADRTSDLQLNRMAMEGREIAAKIRAVRVIEIAGVVNALR